MPPTKKSTNSNATPKTNDASARFDYTQDELEKLDKAALIDVLLANQSFTVKLLANMEDLNKNVSSLKTEMNDLKAKVSAVSTTNSDASQSKRLVELERDNFALQQYSRRDSIEIVGIPESVGDEALEEKTIKLLKAINVNVSASDIQACHRLTKKTRVIVKFVNRKSAISCLRNKAKLKSLDLKKIGLPAATIFINESLCPSYRRLFWRCNELYKQKKLLGVWSYNGTVKIKLSDESVKAILHDVDIESLSL